MNGLQLLTLFEHVGSHAAFQEEAVTHEVHCVAEEGKTSRFFKYEGNRRAIGGPLGNSGVDLRDQVACAADEVDCNGVELEVKFFVQGQMGESNLAAAKVCRGVMCGHCGPGGLFPEERAFVLPFAVQKALDDFEIETRPAYEKETRIYVRVHREMGAQRKPLKK